MAVYINDTVNTDTDCETPIPKVCGRQKVHMPTASCDTIHFTGVDDAEINQGQDFDPTEGVHAYDGNGEEIPFTVEPSEVDECQVGEIELEYTATGVGKKLLPKLCGSPNLKLPYCGVERKRLKRNLVIKGIAPPSIRGIERVCLDRETLFNPMDGVSAVDGNGNTLEVSHSGTYDEVASGEIASFESIGGNSKSLKVALEPIQDLNGYDHPWVGGAGKNKCAPIKADTATGSFGGVTMSIEGDSIKLTGAATLNGGRTVLMLEPKHLLAGRYYISSSNVLGAQPQVVVQKVQNGTYTVLADRVNTSFLLDADTDVAVGFNITNGTTYDSSFSIQLELGSTATSYEPYSNICPISGRTEVVTSVSGFNVWDEEVESGGIYNDTGEEFPRDSFYRCKNYIPIKPNTNYFFKCSDHAINANKITRVIFYDADKVVVSSPSGSATSRVVTSPNNAYYMRFFTNESVSSFDSTASINYPPTDTSYHAYNGTTHTTSLGRTVYGGTLDVVSGELVVDRGYVDLSQQSWLYQSAWGSWYTDYFADMKGTNTGVETPNFISDRFEAIATNYGLTPQDFSGITSTTRGSLGCRILVKNGSTTEAPTGQLVYELAQPQTYQLTPQEVTLLVGNNNVWSDGMVTVAYPTNIPDGAYNYPFDGAYDITYHAEDRCGNETTEVRQVIVSKSNSVCGARVCCATVAC